MSCVQDVFGYKDAAELCLCVPQLLDEAHCVSNKSSACRRRCSNLLPSDFTAKAKLSRDEL